MRSGGRSTPEGLLGGPGEGSVAATPPLGSGLFSAGFGPRPARTVVACSLVFLLVAVGPFLDTAQVWMFKLLIDDVLIPRNFQAFPAIAAGYLGIGLAQGLASFSDELLSAWLGERFVLDLGPGCSITCTGCRWTSSTAASWATRCPG